MVTKYTKEGYAYGEPPYTDEEEREAYAAMAGGPVAMTSVTRPSNATPPPAAAASEKKKDRPGRR